MLPRFGVPLRRLMAGAAPRNCCGAATRSCVCRSSLATVQPCPKRPRTLWQDKTLRVSQHGRGAGHGPGWAGLLGRRLGRTVTGRRGPQFRLPSHPCLMLNGVALVAGLRARAPLRPPSPHSRHRSSRARRGGKDRRELGEAEWKWWRKHGRDEVRSGGATNSHPRGDDAAAVPLCRIRRISAASALSCSLIRSCRSRKSRSSSSSASKSSTPGLLQPGVVAAAPAPIRRCRGAASAAGWWLLSRPPPNAL